MRCPVVHGAADGDALQEDAHLSNGVAGTSCSLYSTSIDFLFLLYIYSPGRMAIFTGTWTGSFASASSKQVEKLKMVDICPVSV